MTISRLCCGQVQTYYSGFHSTGIVNLWLWSAKMLSRCLLIKPVLMVQAAQDWMGHHTPMLRKPVPIRLQRRGQWWRRLRDAWPQGHVGTAVVVMLYPLLEEALQMIFRQ